MSTTKPSYYSNNGKDLFDRFEDGLMPAEQVRGFYKVNIIKYVTRYQGKNGTEDLEKARTYLDRLIKLEAPNYHEKGGMVLSKADTDRLMEGYRTTDPDHESAKPGATAQEISQKLYDSWKDVFKDWDKSGDQS